MAKPSTAPESSDDVLSIGYSSSEEENINDQINEDDEEELEAVARSADADSDDDNSSEAAADGNDVEEDENGGTKAEISKRECERLKEMQKLKKQKVHEILDAQNAAIDADMNNRGKGRLKYLLQQTELFAHFAKGDQSASQKKAKGRFASWLFTKFSHVLYLYLSMPYSLSLQNIWCRFLYL